MALIPEYQLESLRELVVSALVNTCVFTRGGVNTVKIDPDTGEELSQPPVESIVYSGDCLVSQDKETILRLAGGRVDVEGSAVIQLPYLSAVFKEGDLGQVTFNGVTRGCRVVEASYGLVHYEVLVAWDTQAVAAP